MHTNDAKQVIVAHIHTSYMYIYIYNMSGRREYVFD